MTEQQIIFTLATKVMGWTKAEQDYESLTGEMTILTYWKKDNGTEIEWNPLKNIADAWMIVEKIKDNDEQKRHFSAWLALTTGTNSIFGVTPKAISMAAYRLVA